MIKTPAKLKELCELALNHPQIKKLWKVSISHEMFHLFNKWQDHDKYPPLVGFRQGGAYFMVRVR